MPKVVNTIKALKEGGITVSALIIDGADMSKISAADLKTVSDFVQAEKITAWFSDTNESSSLSETLTKETLPLFATVAHLESNGNSVVLKVLKANGKEADGGSVKLDSKTLLMTK